MYYLVAALLRPAVIAYVSVALALVALWRSRASRRRLVALSVAVLLLALLSLPVTSYLALGSLEWPYPPLASRPADAPAIVVLAGSIWPAAPDESRFEPGTDTIYRCLRAAELYRADPCPILLSGGKVHPTDAGPPLAEVMRDFLLTQGVGPDDLIVESSSRTTYENAVDSARLLNDRDIHRIVLVTDAAHLRRAVACFRKQGLDVVPCGCHYRALGRSGGPADYLPDPSAAAGVEEAAHEWFGLALYWLTGRI
jgi:uncharacterized SAM-binding protein YcdF (DUF218 family)